MLKLNRFLPSTGAAARFAAAYNSYMEPVRCANCQALQRRGHDLQAENERLRRQLDEATRAGQRQAAPLVAVSAESEAT